MNSNQHRTLVQTLQTEADVIRKAVLEDLQAKGLLYSGREESDRVKWTGAVQVFGQSVWHLFETPDSLDGLTYYRLSATNQELRSREP